MKNFEELSNFIKNNNDWLSKLRPWLKSYHECDYNNDWAILMYNLFEIPADPLLYKIICECRGTVVNKKTGEIISAPFVKFWNYGEEKADKNIDWKNAIYSMKRDGWLCVDAETIVETENGKKTIKEVIEGNDKFVLSHNDITNENEMKQIIAKKNLGITGQKWYEIETESGKKIKITGNDLLRMKNGAYRKVEQLKINDEIAVKN